MDGDDLFNERISYPYAVIYGWPGLPNTTKIVDLQREVKVASPRTDGFSSSSRRITDTRCRERFESLAGVAIDAPSVC